jgi:DNA-binding transcriptional ArsR family regulator
MDSSKIVGAFGALAQETRLAVFRLLMEEGPEGLPATEIADRLGVRPNLMSSHLGALGQAGLTTSRREGRRIIHAVDLTATRALLRFLVQDCCRGQPDACSSLLDEILPLGRCSSDTSIMQE